MFRRLAQSAIRGHGFLVVLMLLPFALPVAASNAAPPKEIPIPSLEDSNSPSARLMRRIKGRESVQLLLISEQSLPQGSVVRFKEQSFLQHYKWQIAAIVTLCIVEALFIAGLLISRARRKRAEEESIRFAALARAEHRRLDEVVSEREGLSIEFRNVGFPAILPKDTTLNVFRIAQESLHNVLKHSGAQHATVLLEKTDQAVRLSVLDLGCGFDTESDKMTSGLGFISMRERLRLVGGQLSIRSRQPAGTQIEVTVPLMTKAERPSVDPATRDQTDHKTERQHEGDKAFGASD